MFHEFISTNQHNHQNNPDHFLNESDEFHEQEYIFNEEQQSRQPRPLERLHEPRCQPGFPRNENNQSGNFSQNNYLTGQNNDDFNFSKNVSSLFCVCSFSSSVSKLSN